MAERAPRIRAISRSSDRPTEAAVTWMGRRGAGSADEVAAGGVASAPPRRQAIVVASARVAGAGAELLSGDQ